MSIVLVVGVTSNCLCKTLRLEAIRQSQFATLTNYKGLHITRPPIVALVSPPGDKTPNASTSKGESPNDQPKTSRHHLSQTFARARRNNRYSHGFRFRASHQE